MADATFNRELDRTIVRLASSISGGEVWQQYDGGAGFYDAQAALSSGIDAYFKTRCKALFTKATGIKILKGGRCYWDHSANNCTYRKVADRDFYIGRATKDHESGDNLIEVAVNDDPRYDLDMAIDPFETTIVGTQALSGLALLRRGGGHQLKLDTTNEAQKVDILSIDGFSKDANAIVEFAFRVISDGAGTEPDFNIGVANATNATDADSITESVFIHLDGNNTNINAESDDGTTEVAATDTTTDYTEGSSYTVRKECWIDMRDPADVQIYVDGVLVLDGTTFNVNAATGPFKLLAHLEKTASASVYEIAVDFFRVRLSEQ
jgi:hypothetical protein